MKFGDGSFRKKGFSRLPAEKLDIFAEAVNSGVYRRRPVEREEKLLVAFQIFRGNFGISIEKLADGAHVGNCSIFRKSFFFEDTSEMLRSVLVIIP